MQITAKEGLLNTSLAPGAFDASMSSVEALPDDNELETRESPDEMRQSRVQDGACLCILSTTCRITLPRVYNAAIRRVR